MGQQQFLFVVLAAIIVAIALGLAVAYFISYQVNSNINEVINELNSISSAAQGWYLKPRELGGGNHSFTGFSLDKISQADSTDLATYNVVYAGSDSLSLEAVSAPGFISSDFVVDLDVGPHSNGKCRVDKGNGKAQSNGNGNGNSKGG
jgi:predicted PurR-regulated permease PerM